MISVLLCNRSEETIKRLSAIIKDTAAMYSDEVWDITACASVSQLEAAICEQPCYNIIIMDTPLDKGAAALEELRLQNPSAFVIIMADKSTRFSDYVRPQVMAASALIREDGFERSRDRLTDALTYYIKKFYGDNTQDNFVIDSKEGRQLIPYDQICYIEACEKKIMLYTAREQYSFYGTMDDLEKRLPAQFVRCHRSFIVSKKQISKIMLSQGYMVLTHGEMVPVSRTYRPIIKELR